MTWHVVTGEFPPQGGGVSDYSLNVARGLAATGRPVHVWCPDWPGPAPETPGVELHRVAGRWEREDLRRLDIEMARVPGPRRILVQWVPHAFGRRSLNVGFCRWVRRRARAGDTVDIMVHEAFLAFREGSWRQDLAALVHRLMVTILLSEAAHIWVSIPAWADSLRPYRWGRELRFSWLPVPSNIPMVNDPGGVAAIRRALVPNGQTLVGHFGTYGRHTRDDLGKLILLLLDGDPSVSIVLMGRDSDAFRSALLAAEPALGPRLHATGSLDGDALSKTLQACDLFVQPFPDGASTRRTTLMALLAHGIPVVTTEGHLSEPLWRSSTAVSLVPAGQMAALARAALDLCGNREERSRLAEAGRALYAERFDLTHTIHALVSDASRAA